MTQIVVCSLVIWTLVIGIYLEIACLPVGREFGYWDLMDEV